MVTMRVLVLVLYFWYFSSNSFAYDIKPYLRQFAPEGKKFNLVFCPLDYQNNEDFLKDTGASIQRLKRTKPFDSCNSFGFWYISLSKEEESKIFKPTQGFPPLKVRQDFLAAISNHLRSNYKLIIIDSLGSVSCAELSSIDKMSLIILGRNRYSNSDSFAKGFLHELGHSLGLRDECTHCQQLSSAGYPNCAVSMEEAVKWWGDLVGKDERVDYIAGCCGNSSYIRSTIASLMNDPDKAEDFGPVNERYLRNIFPKEAK